MIYTHAFGIIFTFYFYTSKPSQSNFPDIKTDRFQSQNSLITADLFLFFNLNQNIHPSIFASVLCQICSSFACLGGSGDWDTVRTDWDGLSDEPGFNSRVGR